MGHEKSFLTSKGFVQNSDGSFSKPPKVKHDSEPLRISPQNALNTAATFLDKLPVGIKTKSFVVHHPPMGAPRMTRQDKWLKPRRPCVEKYFALQDAIQAAVGPVNDIPDRMDCTFHFAMPESWSDKKKAEMSGKPHRVRPDRDNCEKAVMDSLFVEDGGIHEGFTRKLWCYEGFEKIEIKLHYFPA